MFIAPFPAFLNIFLFVHCLFDIFIAVDSWKYIIKWKVSMRHNQHSNTKVTPSERVVFFPSTLNCFVGHNLQLISILPQFLPSSYFILLTAFFWPFLHSAKQETTAKINYLNSQQETFPRVDAFLTLSLTRSLSVSRSLLYVFKLRRKKNI